MKLQKVTDPSFKKYGKVVENVDFSELVEELKKRGIPCQYHVYPGNAHGWGLATGKAAEGWLDEAVAFWEENLSVKNVGEKQ